MELNNLLSVINIINKLNSFVIDVEKVIGEISATFKEAKDKAFKVYQSKVSELSTAYTARKNKLSKNSKDILHKANEIADKVSDTESQLYDLHKYYKKFKNKNEEKLLASQKVIFQDDLLGQIKNTSEEFHKAHQKLIDTLSSRFKLFIMHGTGSNNTKYIHVIKLNRESQLLLAEVNNSIPDLTQELLKDDDKELAERKAKIDLIYKNEANSLDNQSAARYEQLATEIYEKIDAILPNDYLDEIAAEMHKYTHFYGAPNEDMIFQKSIMFGTVDYPLDTYVSSNILKELLKDKCKKVSEGSAIRLPLACDLDQVFNVFLSGKKEDNAKILNFAHGLMLSFLSFVPTTKLSMTIIDPDGKGNSIRPFLDLKKEQPDLFEGKICTSVDDIYEMLKKLNSYMDDFIQTRLGNTYENIFQYNEATPTNSESIKLLCIYGFPLCFDARCYDALLSLLKNGGRCGIYTIICSNTDAEPGLSVSRYENNEENIKTVKQQCSHIEYSDAQLKLMPFRLEIGNIPMLNSKTMIDFSQKYGEIVAAMKKRGLLFSNIIDDLDYQTGDTSESIEIPIGIGAENKKISLILGGGGSSHHALITGATGSGKSTLLHTIIISAMFHYSPEQLNLYLMDFKSGTEFKAYEKAGLDHIKLIALDAMQEFGESIFENLVDEMKKRGELFKASGCTNLKEYKKQTGNHMPRILVIIDEFQVLFNLATNRKVAANCEELANKIVTEGRSFGIHLIMATQSTRVLYDLSLKQATIDQMRIRLGLKCSETDANYMFTTDRSTKALDLMKGPMGTAVLSEDFTEKEIVQLRIAYCNHELQSHYLSKISAEKADKKVLPQIFEGGRTPMLSEFYMENKDTIKDDATKLLMGTCIKVAPPFIQTIDRKKRYNFLIVGSNEKMLNNIAGCICISLSQNPKTHIYWMDGEIIAGDNTLGYLYDEIKEKNINFRLALCEADILRFINEIYDIYINRKKSPSSENIFIGMNNLQWLDIVNKIFKHEDIQEDLVLGIEKEKTNNEDSDPFDFIGDSFSQKNGAKEKLFKLIEDGASSGIFFVVASNECNNIKESMYMGENVLSKFPFRIIFSLNDNDAEFLINNVSLASLRDNIVYFTDGIKSTFQFKPFMIPNDLELEQVREMLV